MRSSCQPSWPIIVLLFLFLPILASASGEWWPLTGALGDWVPDPSQYQGSSLSPTESRWATWVPEIEAFEARLARTTLPEDVVLFIGSSSIRGWSTLSRDFPELNVINHGFGGSQIVDSIYYADRLVFPVSPKAIVMFAGTNDIAAGKTPTQVFVDYVKFTEVVHETLPETEIFFIAIGPAPSRWGQADRQIEANRMIQAFTTTDERLHFIDIYPAMLGSDGKPRQELFLGDNLHLNAQGYANWTSVVRMYLAEAGLLPKGSRRGNITEITLTPFLNGMRLLGPQEVEIYAGTTEALESLRVRVNGVEVHRGDEPHYTLLLTGLTEGVHTVEVTARAGGETYTLTHRFFVDTLRVLRGRPDPETGYFPVRVESGLAAEQITRFLLMMDGDIVHSGTDFPVEIEVRPWAMARQVSLGIVLTTADGVNYTRLLSLPVH